MNDIQLSPDQADARDAILSFWDKGKRLLILAGYAGVGKSFLLSCVVKELRLRGRNKWKMRDATMAFCSYTGKAADVLRRKLEKNHAITSSDYCGTIHSLIYRPRMDDEGNIKGWERNDSIDQDLIVVDEGSMLDEYIFRDLQSYHKPILVVGDHGQLPPIRGDFNLMSKPDIRLEKIHRQAENSPVIKLSMMARNDGYIPVGEYGAYVSKRTDTNILSSIQNVQDVMVICNYNNFRVETNRQIRHLAGFEWDSPVPGDKLICLRNRKEAGIYNGATGILKRIEDYTTDTYWATVDMGDFEYSGEILKEQFGQPSTVVKVPGWTKENPIDLFDFGYVCTAHKAQGSEHNRVIVFEQRSQYMDDDMWRRWLYTSCTRSSDRLIVIGY